TREDIRAGPHDPQTPRPVADDRLHRLARHVAQPLDDPQRRLVLAGLEGADPGAAVEQLAPPVELAAHSVDPRGEVAGTHGFSAACGSYGPLARRRSDRRAVRTAAVRHLRARG